MNKETCLPCLIHPYVMCKCGWQLCYKHRNTPPELYKKLYSLHSCTNYDSVAIVVDHQWGASSARRESE